MTTSHSSGLGHVRSDDGEDGLEVSGDAWETIGLGETKFLDHREMVSFVKAVERMVRSGKDYKTYLGYLKNAQGMDRCSALVNAGDDDVTVEFHHHPFTLFQICRAVVDRQMEAGPTTTFSAADEVVRLHFENRVGLVPLAKTVHELVHSGRFKIGIRQVFGDVISFIKEYGPYIGPSDLIRAGEISAGQDPGDWSVLDYIPKKIRRTAMTGKDVAGLNVLTGDGE